MKYLDKIIEKIPEKEKNKYLVDIKKVLEKLKPYEVDVEFEFGKSTTIQLWNYNDYLEKIARSWECGNTYNYNGRVSHDINYFFCESKSVFYLAISPNIGKEPRAVQNYIDYSLLKFESKEAFLKIINNIEIETSSFTKEIDGINYIVIPHITSEYLSVCYCEEEYEIYANNDEELSLNIKNERIKRVKRKNK